jgi:hypothetical protein
MDCIGCEQDYWILDCPAHKEMYERFTPQRPFSLEAHFQQWFANHIKEKYGKLGK